MIDYTSMAFLYWVIGISIWAAIWKGFALWRAARRKQKGWFICLFIFNTAGILEILYLFVFSKKR
jgi:hypothetical protein